MTATTYVHNKSMIRYTTRVIKGQKMYAIHQGKEIEESEFRKMFPVPDRLYRGKENPCKKVMNLM